MNIERRKRIDELIVELRGITDSIPTTIEINIDPVRDEEQQYFDDMPESLQNGAKGERAQKSIDALDSAETAMEELNDYLSNVSDKVDEVVAALEEARDA